jgi:hypothetical protein
MTIIQMWSRFFVLSTVLTTLCCLAQDFDEEKFKILVAKMQGDVVEFAQEVERLYATRCDLGTLSSCKQANYDHCRTRYPNQQCLGGPDYLISQCGDGVLCGSLYDYSIS